MIDDGHRSPAGPPVASGARVYPPGEYPSWDPAASLVAFERHDLYDEIVWHEHPQIELALVLEGGGLRGVGTLLESCEDGDLCLVPAGVVHGCSRRRSRVRAVVVHFAPTLAATPSTPELAAIGSLLRRARGGAVIGGRTRDAVASELVKIVAEPRASWRRLLRLLDVLATIASGDAVRAVEQPFSASRRGIDVRLHDVLRRIETSGASDLSHREAADGAGLSPAAFSRLFKRCMGRTFEDYVNEVRIARACRALADSDRPVVDIAFDVGFNSVSHFNRRFRRARGTSPTAYRRRAVASALE